MGSVRVERRVAVVLGQEPDHRAGDHGLLGGDRSGVVVVCCGGGGRSEQGGDGESCGGREAAASSGGGHRFVSVRRRATARPTPASTSTTATPAAAVRGAPVAGRPHSAYSASVISRTCTVSLWTSSRAVSVHSPHVSTQSAPSQAIVEVRCSEISTVTLRVVTVP